MEDERPTLGRQLAEARKAKNWTQEDVAEALQINRGYVSKLESNAQIPSKQLLERIANLLDLRTALPPEAALTTLKEDLPARSRTADHIKELKKISTLSPRSAQVAALRYLPWEVMEILLELTPALEVLSRQRSGRTPVDENDN